MIKVWCGEQDHSAGVISAGTAQFPDYNRNESKDRTRQIRTEKSKTNRIRYNKHFVREINGEDERGGEKREKKLMEVTGGKKRGVVHAKLFESLPRPWKWHTLNKTKY